MNTSFLSRIPFLRNNNNYKKVDLLVTTQSTHQWAITWSYQPLDQPTNLVDLTKLPTNQSSRCNQPSWSSQPFNQPISISNQPSNQSVDPTNQSVDPTNPVNPTNLPTIQSVNPTNLLTNQSVDPTNQSHWSNQSISWFNHHEYNNHSSFHLFFLKRFTSNVMLAKKWICDERTDRPTRSCSLSRRVNATENPISRLNDFYLIAFWKDGKHMSN